MRKNSVILSAFALTLFLFLTACGSGSKPIAVSVTSSSSSTTVPAGTPSVTLTATVSNDTKNGGVTWTLSPSTGCGTLTTTTTSATYYPPSAATLNADCQVTITAISASDSTKTTPVTLTIKAITVTVSSGAGSTTTFGSGAKAVTLTATLNNEATGAGDTVTWSMTSAIIAPSIRRADRSTPAASGATCGTLVPSGNSATYTPPSTIASNCTATITAASTINSHQTSVTTFTVDAIVLNVTAPPSAVTEFAHAGNIALTSTITNDGANGGAGAGVNWTLTAGSCGSISQTGTSLSAFYVPPPSPSAQCTATAMAQSVTDPTKSATTALITINPNIAVAWNPQPPAAVSEGATQALTAKITNDTGKGLSWSISPLTGCGTLSPTSGTTVTYTAPSPLTSTCTATVTVASVADPTFAGASAQASIAVNPTVIVSFSPNSPQSIASGILVPFSATVNYDGGNKGITWTITPLTGCGSLGTATVTGATSAVNYTAPLESALTGGACTATILAAPTADPTKTQSASITTNPISVSLITSTAMTLPATVAQASVAIPLSATISYDTGGGIIWSGNGGCGTLVPGTYNASTGVAQATFTPATSVPSNCTETITVASMADGLKKATTTITVNAIVLNVTAPKIAVTEFAHAGNIALTSTITNDGANGGAGAGVNWTLTAGSCGSISQTGTSLSAFYVPPPSPSAQCTATAMAQSVTDPTKSATTALITINPNIAVAWNPQPPAAVSEGATQALTASIANDTGKGLNWSISPLTGCGTLSPTSGTTVTYTAPSPLASACSATVTVASVADPTFAGASAQASIAVNPTVIVSFLPNSPQSIASGILVPFSATVNYDGGNKGITWTITPLTGCGSLGTATVTGATSAVNYTAPLESALTGGACTATIAAAPTAELTKAQSVAITANPISVSPITSTAMTLPATVGQSSNPAGIPLSATISYDTGGGLIWNGTGGCGTFVVGTYNASTGVAQAVFTPAPSVPSNCTETITVASMADGLKKATTTITVTPLTVSILPSGTITMQEGASQPLVASVIGGGTQPQSVNWILNPPTGCGSLAFPSGLATTPNTFFAPNPPVAGCSATVTAQSQSDLTKFSNSVTLNVVPPAIVVNLTNQGPWFIDASNNNGSSTYTINGMIANDFTLKGVNLISSNPACGSIGQIVNPGVASGAFSAVFTAAADNTLATGSNCVTTITTISNADTTKLQTSQLTVYPISINITPGGNQNYITGSPNVTFNATVNNDAIPGPGTSGAGVTWSLNPSGCGLINNQTLTSVTFVPPASGSSSCSTQLIATSNADPNRSNFDSISVNPPGPALSIDPTANGNIPSGVVGQTYQLYLNAQGGVTPYASFTTASGTIPPGLSYSVTSNSLVGTPTADSGTYPHTYTFTVAVKDYAGTTATSPLVTVVISSAPNHEHDSWLNGRYVCLTKGFIDNSGGSPFPWASLSSLPLTGTSTYTGGIYDMAYGGTVTGAGLLTSGTVTGTVNIGADNHGIVTFAATPTGGSAGKPSTWAVEANNNNGIVGTTASELHAIEIDDIGTTPSGQHGDATCYQANTSVFNLNNVAGQSLAFAVAGTNAGGLAKDSIGVVTLSSTGQTVTGGNVDNAKGDGTNSGTNGNSVSSGTTYTTPDPTTGRFVVTVTAGKNTDNMYIYTIDAKRAVTLVVSSNPTSVDGMQSGNVRKQLNGPYSNASLNGPFVVYYHSKAFTGTTSVSVVGYGSTLMQGTGDSATGFTINQSYQDQAAVCTTGNCTGTLVLQGQNGQILFTVASNGRVAFTPPNSTGPIYFYMYDNNSALIMDATGSSQGNSLGIGWVDSQTATTSTNVAGTYAMFNMPPSDPNADNNIGMLTLASNNITGTSDSAGWGWFSWDESLSDNGGSITYSGPGTYGVITITQTGTTKGLDCLSITATKFACISGDDKPNINIMAQ